MRLVGLISGGKDSVYNLMQCIAAGHEIVAIANIEPNEKKHELDSYMYQTVGHEAVSLLAGAISLPIYRHRTLGTAMCKEKVYVETEHDEVEDLYNLLQKVKEEKHIEGVAVGAIASDYQRTRVENVCKRLNLKSFAYLWQRNQEELLEEMIQAEMEVIIIKVASLGLNPDVHLGMNIRELQPYVIELNRKFGVNVCGEGGEYETLVLDCPLFQRRINIIESEKIIHSSDAFAPVGYLNIKNATLEAKVNRSTDPLSSMEARISRIKKIIRTPFFYVQDCIDDLTAALFPEKRRLLSQPEILPHPFNSMTKADEPASSASIQEYWKGPKEVHHKEGHSSSATKQTTHVVTFSPSSILSIDTALCQLNYTSGWCSVANVTAPTVKEALGFVRKHLERVQFSMDDIVFVSMYISDMNEWPKANKMYSQCIRGHLPPARAFVATPLPQDTAVQMVIYAHKLISKTQKVMHHTINRDNIYVQSVSNWAPANIGPYSQCVRVGDVVYVSGQIPLIPGTMELLNKPIFHQCRLALRHVSRILKCVDSNFSLSKILHATCFVTAEEIAVDIMEMWNYITRNVDAVVAVIVVTALPRNAQLEWQVIGCKYEKPVYDRSIEHLSDDVFMRCSRCRYPSQMTSSVSCSAVFTKKAFKLYKNKPIPADVVASILKFCLQYIRYEVTNTGTPLTIVNIYYRGNDSHLATVLTDITKSTHEFKVVVSVIPVVGFSEPEIFLIITGVSH